jgi:hypothetical protein
VFGEVTLLHRIEQLSSAAAIDEVLIATIPAPEYLRFLMRYPAAMMQQLRHTAAAFLVAIRNERQLFASLEERLANVLLSYADFLGVYEGDTLVISQSLSRQDLADALGTVRRSVVQIMSRWTKAGLVERRDGKIVLRDPLALERLAAPIRDSLCYRMGMPLVQLTRTDRLPAAELELVETHDQSSGGCFQVGDEIIIGRDPGCRLSVDDPLVSPCHCRVFRATTGKRYWVEDLQSEHGTWLRGKPIGRAVLRDGDVVRAGGTCVVFRAAGSRLRSRL